MCYDRVLTKPKSLEGSYLWFPLSSGGSVVWFKCYLRSDAPTQKGATHQFCLIGNDRLLIAELFWDSVTSTE